MDEQSVRRARVFGRVQMVGYRAWAKGEADARGLRGWVRNEADGSVTVVVAGDTEQLDAFLAALENGPPAARVDRIDLEAAGEAVDVTEFVVRR